MYTIIETMTTGTNVFYIIKVLLETYTQARKRVLLYTTWYILSKFCFERNTTTILFYAFFTNI